MFQIQSYISKITTMGNHSLRLQVDLEKELNPDENAKVFDLYNKLGWFIFKEAEINPEDVDVPDYVKEFRTDKSPSQRLRAVLYRVWEQSEQVYDFPIWYESQMERIINKYKSTLEV